ncbi:MAG: glutamate-1-semialdehyde 2,1-aminomutase [Elusimicrobiota bacterium]|jgi:glutamate-1-semialdehyde 2,1-aminomutase
MTKSKAFFARAQKVLVGGVNSPVRAFKGVGGTPVFMRKGLGAHLTDADGNRYLDYCLSWGPLILGHAHVAVTRAAEAALYAGSSFGAPTEGEHLLAEEIRRALPSMERVRLTSSGTEAVMSALRAARAFTGRDLTLKFTGCYHGHADSLLVAAGSGAATLSRPDSAGVPADWAKSTLLAVYNDPEGVREVFRRHGSRIAAVIVEPAAANMGLVPPEPGFLELLRSLTRKHGALLVFDEVITGFRAAYGGWQTLCGVKPDLTCLGKIIGGGFPVGAYGGRREIMELVSPLGAVYQAGTLSGNPVAVAAGLATLKALKREDPYRRMERLAGTLAAGLVEAAAQNGVPVQVHQTASMLTVFFTKTRVRDWGTASVADRTAYGRFFHGLLENGVYFPPAQFETAMLSSRHTETDVERTVEAASAAFAKAR